MATTKFSVSAYTADGVTTDFLITWDYLDEDHIAVYVDGTPNYDPTSTYTFEQINATTLRITDEFGNAVPSGSAIEIRRETPIATRAVTFVDGSSFLAEDLNKNSDYLLYSMQEALDTVEAAAQDGALAAQVATEALRDETQVLRDQTEVLKDTTGTYLATVQADATAADNHRIAAAASEAAAATSETNAATSETNAAASATASATSAANALASEQASATSEAAALASQQAAETAEIGAAASATAAATSETNSATTLAIVENIYDQFDDRYLGSKSSDPTLDNDGNALVTGALYFSTTENLMKVYNGSAWFVAFATGQASNIDFTPVGNISSTDVQAAIAEVDNENVSKTGDTGSAVLPSGSTLERDASPVAGYLRWNSTEGAAEIFDGTAWTAVGGAGGGLFKGENGTVGSSAGDIFRVNEQELNTNVTIDSTENASCAGPLAIATGVTLTVNGNLTVV